LVDVLWATISGVTIGVAAGVALAHVGWKLRSKPHEHALMDDFLGLGLIGVVYGLTVMVNGWGFLAVFFAAVALRQTELKLAKAAQVAFDASKTQQALRAYGIAPEPELPQTVSQGSLVFKEHLERLSEVVLVLLIGGTLFLNSWSWKAVGLALFLFVVVRPVSVIFGLLGTNTTWRIRGMTGWFGVRGIGSLYYLMYAIENGLPESLSLQLIQMTLIVVTLSILLHGTSVKPLMALFWRRGKQRTTP
jgi:sodium/hydrogen antiporter